MTSRGDVEDGVEPTCLAAFDLKRSPHEMLQSFGLEAFSDQSLAGYLTELKQLDGSRAEIGHGLVNPRHQPALDGDTLGRPKDTAGRDLLA